MKTLLVDVRVHEAALRTLQANPDLDVRVIDPCESARELPYELIHDVQYLFCTYPPKNFHDMGSLEWIQIASAGYAQLYGLGLEQSAIRLSNARGCFDVPIAEWNVAMMVNLARDLRQMIRNQENAIWDRGAVFQREIRSKTVGIWGYGGIGRETARLAKALGMSVVVLSRTGVGPAGDVYSVPGTGDPDGSLPDRVFLYKNRTAFLAELDFLILAMPLTPDTEGIVGPDELRALPTTSYLLNPSRGPLVQENALLQALQENWIAGAAIDTHYQYPLPAEHPLWRFENVILTPHISGSSLSPFFTQRIWDIFLDNVSRFGSGSPLLNELTL